VVVISDRPSFIVERYGHHLGLCGLRTITGAEWESLDLASRKALLQGFTWFSEFSREQLDGLEALQVEMGEVIGRCYCKDDGSEREGFVVSEENGEADIAGCGAVKHLASIMEGSYEAKENSYSAMELCCVFGWTLTFISVLNLLEVFPWYLESRHVIVLDLFMLCCMCVVNWRVLAPSVISALIAIGFLLYKGEDGVNHAFTWLFIVIFVSAWGRVKGWNHLKVIGVCGGFVGFWDLISLTYGEDEMIFGGFGTWWLEAQVLFWIEIGFCVIQWMVLGSVKI
jgi:hypothetical protein